MSFNTENTHRHVFLSLSPSLLSQGRKIIAQGQYIMMHAATNTWEDLITRDVTPKYFLDPGR